VTGGLAIVEEFAEVASAVHDRDNGDFRYCRVVAVERKVIWNHNDAIPLIVNAPRLRKKAKAANGLALSPQHPVASVKACRLIIARRTGILPTRNAKAPEIALLCRLVPAV
jgi:hypothetical protein